MHLPTVTLPKVWHVGTLDRADKGAVAPSWEGSGLSVSLDPDAWIRIAKLGGQPIWTLTREAGAFVDAHRIDGASRTALLDWGRRRGLVADSGVFEVSWWDPEWHGQVAALFADAADAAAEAAELGGQLRSTMRALATRELLTRTGQHADAPTDALELLLPVYTESATDLDGVWWDDLDDADRLSAPRGVIATRHVNRWTATPAACSPTACSPTDHRPS